MHVSKRGRKGHQSNLGNYGNGGGGGGLVVDSYYAEAMADCVEFIKRNSVSISSSI